ncbi:hypothetical protein BJ170DRAFT_37003 [Xylariales sp. AK1849]|nr:hypothetical protein BJ170DRAFT_37003 [Xylariales sp. AK1849]
MWRRRHHCAIFTMFDAEYAFLLCLVVLTNCCWPYPQKRHRPGVRISRASSERYGASNRRPRFGTATRLSIAHRHVRPGTFRRSWPVSRLVQNMDQAVSLPRSSYRQEKFLTRLCAWTNSHDYFRSISCSWVALRMVSYYQITWRR